MEPEKYFGSLKTRFEEWYSAPSSNKPANKTSYPVTALHYPESAMDDFRDKEERIEECAQMLAKKYGTPDDWEAFVDIVREVDRFMKNGDIHR